MVASSAPPATIRYWCIVAPAPSGDTSYAYMVALANIPGRWLRAQSIGMTSFECERRWWVASSLFIRPLASTFVNVVYARPGMVLGVKMAVARTAPTLTAGDRDAATPVDAMRFLEQQIGGAPRVDDLAYEPAPVLEGLWTKGCTNVAIVDGDVAKLTPRELAALIGYDAVITTARLDADALTKALMPYGLHAVLLDVQRMAAGGDLPARDQCRLHPTRVIHIGPRADLFTLLFEDLCGSGSSATGRISPATGAPPATTAPLSPATPAIASSSRSSTGRPSRSPALRRPAPARWSAPSPGIAISTRSSAPPGRFRQIVSRMWRSVTASLAFWRRWSTSRRS